MKREKRLTKRERRGNAPAPAAGDSHADHHHIHCIACGRHIDPDELEALVPGAVQLRCEHGSQFFACSGCRESAQRLIAEHDRTGKAVASAAAWH